MHDTQFFFFLLYFVTNPLDVYLYVSHTYMKGGIYLRWNLIGFIVSILIFCISYTLSYGAS